MSATSCLTFTIVGALTNKDLNATKCSRFPITSLPGWDGALPSKQETGWGEAGHAPNNKGLMYFHYWFLEAEHHPADAPVVVWYNGGPGASSLFGLLVELGPLQLNVESTRTSAFKKTGIPSLIYNKYGWTQVANLLIVDNPPPVGFSYCDPAGQSGDGYSCGDWNDSLVALANAEFLANWVAAFPEYSKSDLFITGESYAGIYVPNIAEQLVKNPRGVNLKGFAVGDGCMGTEVLCGPGRGPFYNIEFMHGHGQFSNKLYNAIKAQCPVNELKKGPMSPECSALVSKMSKEIGGYYGYNLYDTCAHPVFDAAKALAGWDDRQWWGPQTRFRELRGAVNDYPCPGDVYAAYLNRTDVRKALNIPEDANFFSGDNGVGFNYTLTERNVLPFYKETIDAGKLRILVYNGDTDPGINSFVTQDLYFDYFDTHGINVTAEWRPWTLDGETDMAGYVTEYGAHFTYLTIRGSGHMVPEFKPAASLGFLKTFVEGSQYPGYHP